MDNYIRDLKSELRELSDQADFRAKTPEGCPMQIHHRIRQLEIEIKKAEEIKEIHEKTFQDPEIKSLLEEISMKIILKVRDRGEEDGEKDASS